MKKGEKKGLRNGEWRKFILPQKEKNHLPVPMYGGPHRKASSLRHKLPDNGGMHFPEKKALSIQSPWGIN